MGESKMRYSDLNTKQKQIIRKETLIKRIVWLLLPVVYLLRARAYVTVFVPLVICFLLVMIGIQSTYQTPWFLEAIFWLYSTYFTVMRIWLFIDWPKRAYNNSEWYLINLVKWIDWDEIQDSFCCPYCKTKKNFLYCARLISEWHKLYCSKCKKEIGTDVFSKFIKEISSK